MRNMESLNLSYYLILKKLKNKDQMKLFNKMKALKNLDYQIVFKYKKPQKLVKIFLKKPQLY